MIEITIKNFQSIESLTLNVEGFTTLVGKSNIGKSAVIRAISSALMNLPVTGMVRKGASHCSVEMKSSSYHILWEKGEKGINRYTINGKVYDKVGASVPEEIRQLGFKEIEIGSSADTPWFASQFSPVFLLDKPGSQVTEFISEVSRLRVLQDAINMASKGKRQYGDAASQKSAQLKGIQSKLEKFQELTEVESLVQDLKNMKESIADYEAQEKVCSALSDQISAISNIVDKISDICDQVRLPDEVEGLTELSILSGASTQIKKARDSESKLAGIDNMIIQDFDLSTDMKSLKNVDQARFARDRVKVLGEVIDVPECVLDFTQLEALTTLSHEIGHLKMVTSVSVAPIPSIDDFDFKDVEQLEKLNDVLKENARVIRSCKQKALDLDSEYKELESEIAKVKVCPTCDRAV